GAGAFPPSNISAFRRPFRHCRRSIRSEVVVMGPGNPLLESDKKFYSVEDANRALPLVRAIVTDIVAQYHRVEELQQRLALVRRDRRRDEDDLYADELDQTRGELDVEEDCLRAYVDELRKLGVELKSEDGLCDFPSMRDGR